MTTAIYSKGKANTTLILLLLAYILSFIDRNVMSVLIGPIREDFNISDFQYSILHGFAFSMFYITLGIPIARMADKHNRFNIISGGIVIWSAMTCLCGFAKNFISLFFARMGVGLGEAALSPAAFSILSDIYEKDKLPLATAIYSLGITLGGGLAYILGSQTYNFFSNLDLSSNFFLSNISAWQLTFIMVGLPGFVIALAIKFLPEPSRRFSQNEATVIITGPSVKDVLLYFRLHWKIYLGIIGSMSLMSVLGYGIMAWYPELLIRIYEVDRNIAGSRFGLIFIISGSLGALIGGWICSRLIKAGVIDAPIRIILAVSILWLIPSVFAPLSSSAEIAFLMVWPIIFFLNSYFGIGVTAIVMVSPENMKAQASAILLFFTNLFGLAFGPTVVALLTDFIYFDDNALDASLSLLPLLVLPFACFLSFLSLRPYRELITSKHDL